MGIITNGARPWVIRSLRRYQVHPGLTPRPARVARLYGVVDARARDQITLLVYGIMVLRGDQPDELRFPAWDRPLGLAAAPGREDAR